MDQGFLDYLRVEAGLSRNSVTAYEQDLNRFCDYATESKIRFPEDIDRRTIILYLGWLRDQGHKVSSIRRRLSGIRQYFRYLVDTRVLVFNPAHEIELPRDWQRLPKTLSAREVTALIRAPLESDQSYRFRDHAILEFLYSTGTRVSELCQLRLGDLQTHERLIRVKGKGDKIRIIPIGQLALSAFQRYGREERAAVAQKSKDPGYLFLSPRGLKLRREAVYKICRDWSSAIGITPTTPHMLRHTYASHLLAGGANLREVQ